MTTNTKFGETSWTETVGGGKTNNKDLFLKLEKNTTSVVRIITKPFQYMQHRWVPENAPPSSYGFRINCSGKDCPLCAQANSENNPKLQAKQRWLLGVIDRKTSAYKVLDIGTQIFKSIQGLNSDEGWGNPENYDLSIKTDATSPNSYYMVTPRSAKALSVQDLQMKDAADLDDLKRRCVPPTPEKVVERMEKLSSDLNLTSATKDTSVKASKETKKVAPQADFSDEEEDLNFPSYDAQQS